MVSKKMEVRPQTRTRQSLMAKFLGKPGCPDLRVDPGWAEEAPSWMRAASFPQKWCKNVKFVDTDAM